MNEEIKAFLEEVAKDTSTHYGYFYGGNPNHFHPDEESCTLEELENHRKACANYKETPCKSDCIWINNVHFIKSGFGIGAMEEPTELALKAQKILAKYG